MPDNMDGYVDKMRAFNTAPPTGAAYAQYPPLPDSGGMKESSTLSQADLASLQPYGAFLVAAQAGYEGFHYIAQGSGDLYAEGNQKAVEQFVNQKEVPV